MTFLSPHYIPTPDFPQAAVPLTSTPTAWSPRRSARENKTHAIWVAILRIQFQLQQRREPGTCVRTATSP